MVDVLNDDEKLMHEIPLFLQGYEVILAHDALDEILIANLRQWKGLQFQDVSKKGLVFGGELFACHVILVVSGAESYIIAMHGR
jgi:hypothetical protein